MNKHYEAIHRYDFLTKELLEQEYVVNGLSDRQIAEKYNVDSKTRVWAKRKKLGIANRYAAKSNKNARKNRKFDITKEKATHLLDDGYTIQEIADHMGCSLMVANRRLKELGLCKEQDHIQKYTHLEIELNTKQKEMLIGSALGDGTITKHGAYSCSHSIKQQDYFHHKMQVLASICSGKFQHHIHAETGVDGLHHESLHFTTGCNKYLIYLRDIYYPKGTKIFPDEFSQSHLTAMSIAYWYMDDGTVAWGTNGRGFASILTYGYAHEDQILMQKLLATQFDLLCKPRYIPDKGWILRFSTDDTPKLFDLIRPFIIPSMLYKVDYDAYLKWKGV